MSQAELLSPSPVVPSFPPLSYQGVPVLTTEMLAQAYAVEPYQIRQNFRNNRERFVEGKHFFIITSCELKEFRLQVESFYSQISSKVRVLTLWTERGAARNAKMLDSDRAWDVFELLEETFFRVAHPEPVPAPSPISKRTDPECKALTAIINTWVGMAPVHYASARAQVNAHFGVTSVDALTVAQVKEAIQWVQAKIDALSAVPAPASTPALPASNVYADRVKELTDLERRFMDFTVETRTRFSELNAEYIRLNQGAYAAMLGMIPTMDFAAKDRLIDALASQSYDAYSLIDDGLHCMRRAILAARAANRALSGRS
ncbi:ORF6N domain-containing protein [uncultured Bilophila sp.]|uniref:ORF6N domain-containing protein n=1 Tax=uncultured Bilophila sp. TaxID=529385 RepID=UPI002670058E|nr:ORF6N domain-containing protein [uncultured Bilophila sp.]